MTGQGHHLVAILVGTFYDRKVFNFANGVGIQAGVAVVMRAFAHAAELITGLL